MKRYFTILAALGVAHATMAQSSQDLQRQSALDHPDVRSIYNSTMWQRAMAGYYGVDTNVAPQPETADIQQVQQIAPMLQDENQMEAAALALDQYRSNIGEDAEYSAIIDQIIGSIYFQLAGLTENEAEQERFNRLAQENLELAIERFPNYRQAHKNLANLLFKQGNGQEAKQHFVRALELGDKDPITYGIRHTRVSSSQRPKPPRATASC